MTSKAPALPDVQDQDIPPPDGRVPDTSAATVDTAFGNGAQIQDEDEQMQEGSDSSVSGESPRTCEDREVMIRKELGHTNLSMFTCTSLTLIFVSGAYP